MLCTHVAESAEEFEMFERGKGRMFDWLKASGREMEDCGRGSPVRHMERCGALGKNLLAIHLNYLRRGDADLLAKKEVNVVHCPRSHRYFGHDRFPRERLRRAGVNICLGTDSLATVLKRRREPVELNLFEEMQHLASEPDAPSAKTIVKMATINSAHAPQRTKRWCVRRNTPARPRPVTMPNRAHINCTAAINGNENSAVQSGA